MVREIMRDVFFLAQKSEPATEADLQVARDLLDTLEAHANECVGMAANMIGEKKQIIAVNMGLVNVAMLNPAIRKKTRPFETEEGCLSLTGTRKTKRFMFRDLPAGPRRSSSMSAIIWRGLSYDNRTPHLQSLGGK